MGARVLFVEALGMGVVVALALPASVRRGVLFAERMRLVGVDGPGSSSGGLALGEDAMV